MNRRELVNAIAAQTGHASRDVDEVLKGFTDVVTAVAAKGEAVTVSGFAKFVRRETKARMGRNPATGEAIRIKASKRARITPLKGFKDAVLNPSTAPKLGSGVWPPKPGGPAKKTASKAPAKKTAAKKTTAKKTTAKKTTAKKTTAKKKAPAKRAPAKRAASRR